MNDEQGLASRDPFANDRPAGKARPSIFRFSLKTLMLLMLGVAIFLGGRASTQWRLSLSPDLAGPWSAKLPRGFVRPTTLQDLGGNQYQLSSQASIFNGVYEWRSGQLVVLKPTDKRMLGLVWQWDGKQLTLVGEPASTPTGSSYVGTVLSPGTAPASNPAPPPATKPVALPSQSVR